MSQHVSPEYEKEDFNCPVCGAYASQEWLSQFNDPENLRGGTLRRCVCYRCKQYSIWHRGRMIYPTSGSAPMPNPDLPEEIKVDYEEARSIVTLSPRGAAALLRLAIERLCAHLDAKGRNLNQQIADLVERGLDPTIQKSLDIVRVIGNEAVHPGQIDLKDDQDTAAALFELVNVIAQRMISHPKLVEQVYKRLPESKKKAIEERDSPKAVGSA